MHLSTHDSLRYSLLCAAIGLAVIAARPLAHAAAPAKSMRVAVVAFHNTSGDAGLDSLGKGLQSMITTDLAKVGVIELVERDRLQDIQAELSLAKSRMIDGKTAARLGKLAGATHLLAGTFTVHGAKMRIDARMFAVERGSVLLAEEITGDKEAFFELEKSLVDKLVAALGVKLAPKERAQVARIHTADFEAFRRFSQGVAHFDEQRYQEAIAALRQATELDADFDLARITLAEYERIAAEIRARADSIAASRVEIERLEKDRQAQSDAQMVARLFEIADRPGKGDRARRLAALLVLAGFYGRYRTNHGRVSRFQDNYDGFAVRRMGEMVSKRYLGEAVDAFPAFPTFATGQFVPHPPESPAALDEVLERTVKEITGASARSRKDREHDLLDNLTRLDDGALPHLLLDVREEIRLRELALERATKLGADRYHQRKAVETLARLYRLIGEIDASTAMFARQSTLTDEPDRLKEIAVEIDRNRELAQAYAQTRLKRQLEEYMGVLRNPGYGKPWLDRSLFEGQRPSPKLLAELARGRQVEPRQHWFFGDEPCWVFMGKYLLHTGERVDRLRSSELRYYQAGRNRMHDEDALVAMGAMPRRDLEASFTVVFRPADDWWPRHASSSKDSRAALDVVPGRPEVGFVFGLRDLEQRSVYNRETRESLFSSPTRAIAVRLTSDAIQVVDLGEPAPSKHLRKDRMTMKVLAEKQTDLSREQSLPVTIRVQGKQVSVKVGRGPQHTFQLPASAETAGFTGFHVRGQGYVGIANLELRSL